MQKFSPEETEILVQSGDYLQSNDLFSALDGQRWILYRGHAQMMCRLLSKYHRQIHGHFGEFFSSILGRAPEYPSVCIEYKRNSYGQIAVFEARNLPKDRFWQYKDLVKSFGLWFNAEDKTWFVPSKNMEQTNFQLLFRKIYDLNFEIEEQFAQDWFE